MCRPQVEELEARRLLNAAAPPLEPPPSPPPAGDPPAHPAPCASSDGSASTPREAAEEGSPDGDCGTASSTEPDRTRADAPGSPATRAQNPNAGKSDPAPPAVQT